MLFIFMVFVAVSLAMDAFAASVSCGMTRSETKTGLALKVSVLFGGAQALMFVIGWLGGIVFETAVSPLGNWIAFALLFIIGSRMIHEAVRNWRTGKECRPLMRRELLFLSVATSIDALVVGVSFGFLGTSLLLPVVLIGAVTFALSFTGVLIGDRLRAHLDRWAEIIAGLVLIGLGIRFLLDGIL